ncbi:MAG: 50S ribosomal protein L23 [Planctomycetes bacterium]|nr:50S ribosomal protein L23 [Planctomycetota bacterium]
MPEFNPVFILQRPVVTEKTTGSIDHLNAYVFQVAPRANKIEIKKAVEKQFNVKVIKVNTRWKQGKMKRLGKTIGRTSPAKEAIVTLRPGDKIDVY